MVSVVLLAAGAPAMVLGARTVGGAVGPVGPVAVAVLVALVRGEPKPPASTVINGLPGQLAGKLYSRFQKQPILTITRGPFSSWTGTWSGCSSTTDEPIPATVTTTVTGSDGATQTLTGTTFGIQAVESDSGAGAIAVHVSTGRGIGAFVAVAAGVFAAMIAL